MAHQTHELILSTGLLWAYRAAVVCAAMIGGALVRHDSRHWPVSRGVRYQVLGVVALGSLIGCALPAFFAGGTIGDLTTWSLLAPKTILGGLLFGFFAIAGFKRSTGNRADTSDAFARGAIAMMLVGRLGCIARHCCYGKATTLAWGVDLGDGVLRVPVQALEAAGLLALALGVQWLHVRDHLRGRRLFALFAAYGLLRFGLEYLRAPVSAAFLGFGFYQWLALLLCAVGVFQLVQRSLRRRAQAETEALQVGT